MSLLGLTPSRCFVDLGSEMLHVQLSWGFRLTAPRFAIASAVLDDDPVHGWGAHGYGGKWLVNGSSTGLVRITFVSNQRGWTSGFPIRVNQLRVSLVDRNGFLDAINAGATHREPNDAGPDTTDPNTTDPNTTDPNTTDPNTTGPDTTDPNTSDPNDTDTNESD